MDTKYLEHIINECERLAAETGEPHFVLDWKILHEIKKKSIENKEDKRELDLEEILEEQEYEIGDWTTVQQMPSMEIIYDSVSKLTDKEERTKWAVKELERLGFITNSIFDLVDEEDRDGLIINSNMEFSMTLSLEHRDELGAKISPNLLTKITHFTTDTNNFTYELNEIYNGYLIIADIIEVISKNVKGDAMKTVIRDMIIGELLN
jgi:SepF-like predicted cell division protein (DUF552 family)